MSDKIEETIKLLVDEGRRKGFLTYAGMAKLMEDQFLPPEKMDQVAQGRVQSVHSWLLSLVGIF